MTDDQVQDVAAAGSTTEGQTPTAAIAAQVAPPTPDQEDDAPNVSNLVITPGELFTWNGFFWRVISQVQVGEGKQLGLIIVPTEPTSGALKRHAAGKKKALRTARKLQAAGRAYWPTREAVLARMQQYKAAVLAVGTGLCGLFEPATKQTQEAACPATEAEA